MPDAPPPPLAPPTPAIGTLGALHDEVERLLVHAGVPLARAEARDLIAALLDVPRFWPTLHREEPADATLRARALAAAGRRARGAPFAYAVGRAAFRHLTLDVDERVLIPRVETEQLVELALAMVPVPGGVAVDIGTGSGAIALALASEGRFERVVATDVSSDALAVARRNVELARGVLRCPVELRQGSLLAPVRELRPVLLVSNPPYIASSEAAELPAGVRDWEPPLALFGGGDGLGPTRRIVRGAARLLAPGGALVLEVDARRAALVAELVSSDARFREVSVLLDLAGRERFVTARR